MCEEPHVMPKLETLSVSELHYVRAVLGSVHVSVILRRNIPLLDNGLLKHVSLQRTLLEESKRCPEIDARFVETDEIEKNGGIVRHDDFYEGRVTVIKVSVFVNSSERETDVVQDSQKVIRKRIQKAVQ
jgi:hypothetical protein